MEASYRGRIVSLGMGAATTAPRIRCRSFLVKVAMSPSSTRQHRVSRFLGNPLRFLTIGALLFAACAHVVRQDLRLTRLTVNRPGLPAFAPVAVSPLVGAIVAKLSRTDWQYTTRSYDTLRASAPLEYVRGELKVDLPNAAQHLKLWDFLDESYVTGPDILPGKALKLYTASIHIAEPINQAGFCDYLSQRIVPAFYAYLARRDYVGARNLSLEANAWIDVLKPNPQLAGESPRLQNYVNFFRRFDALLDDPAMLYAHPDVADKIVEYMKGSKAVPMTLANFLAAAEDPGVVAWGRYFSAAGKLSTLNYAESAHDFRAVAASASNKKLADLAQLGHVRATFWAAMSGELNPLEAARTLHSAAFASPRFDKDVQYYLAQLKSPAVETDTDTARQP